MGPICRRHYSNPSHGGTSLSEVQTIQKKNKFNLLLNLLNVINLQRQSKGTYNRPHNFVVRRLKTELC